MLRLSPGRAGQVPGLFSLRLGSLLERAGSDQQAYALYRRICETAPSSADAEAAWFRAGGAGAALRRPGPGRRLLPPAAPALSAGRPGPGRPPRPRRLAPRAGARRAPRRFGTAAQPLGPPDLLDVDVKEKSMPRYDLAGNPLPEDTAAPAARDLGGNPVPAPVARTWPAIPCLPPPSRLMPPRRGRRRRPRRATLSGAADHRGRDETGRAAHDRRLQVELGRVPAELDLELQPAPPLFGRVSLYSAS